MRKLELTEEETIQLLVTVNKNIKEIKKMQNKQHNRQTAEKFSEIINPLKSVRGKLFETLGIDPNEHL
jgi:hypothetical protein